MKNKPKTAGTSRCAAELSCGIAAQLDWPIRDTFSASPTTPPAR